MKGPARGFTLVELMMVIGIVGILAALAVYGVGSYVARAKSAEAITNLGAMSKAVSATATHLAPLQGVTNPAPGLCATSTFVPNAVRDIRGKKYQPRNSPGADYNSGDTHTGWRCLRFSIGDPQRYRYRYQTGGAPTQLGLTRRGRPPGVRAAEAWSVSAQGDLDGDAVYAWFAVMGYVTKTRDVIVAPGVHRQDEGE